MTNTQAPTRVAIVGLAAYTGQEAARLVGRHPNLRLVAASSDAMAGASIHTLLPTIGLDIDVTVVGHGDSVAAAIDEGAEVALLATPPNRSDGLVGELLQAGLRVVDLSGAHRIEDPTAHIAAYGYPRESHRSCVYGLTEWTTPEILSRASLVSNPGGFPTAALLPLLPLLTRGLITPERIVMDAKSGTTGAGRSAKISLLHGEVDGNLFSDRVGCQRHTPEIVQELQRHGAADVALTFVAHLMPVARGIVITTYVALPKDEDAKAMGILARDMLRSYYSASPFVRVLERPEAVQMKSVVHTNHCHIGVSGDPNGQQLVIISALDNLVKGGAGQAIQNLNLMLGLDETAGF